MNNHGLDQNDITKKTEKLLSRDKCVGIYGLRNKITNKWYIGQSWDIDLRLSNYKSLSCKNQPKIYSSLKKNGFSNFDFVLIELCDKDQSTLDSRETYWIKFHDSIKNGYNLREGGSNGKLSNEVKNKISFAKTGKRLSPETKEKIRQTMLLKCKNDDYRKKITNRINSAMQNPMTREKMKTSATGRKLSDEAKQKCKDASLRWWDEQKIKPQPCEA